MDPLSFIIWSPMFYPFTLNKQHKIGSSSYYGRVQIMLFEKLPAYENMIVLN